MIQPIHQFGFHKIGFMQGRLSPQIDGKIQAFPWDHWAQEIPLAEKLGFSLMEWTLDQDRLYQNPLMTPEGQQQIQFLIEKHKLQIGSLTGDCFMQAPFYKAEFSKREALLNDLRCIVEACAVVGIRMIVFPLVDAGRLENQVQEQDLKSGLEGLIPLLREKNVKIIFESDFEPKKLGQFIDFFPSDFFGINYDIGNSASLGFDPNEEFGEFAERILNVHVKDRVLGGTTVPLGTGSADFNKVFSLLKSNDYKGDFILQTARAADGDHRGVLARYRQMVQDWLGADA